MTKNQSIPRTDTVIAHYRHARYITLGLLALFVVITLIFGRSGLTSENMRYLVRSLSFDALSGDTSLGRVSFESGDSVQVGYYQNELAVLTEYGFSLVSPGGKVTFRDIVRRQNPRMSVSDRYILVYDRGGLSYSLFNSFDEVIGEEFSYPITCGDVSNSGVYALVTRETGYNSVARIYNRSGALIGRIYKAEKYIVGISVSSDGRYVVILSLAEAGGMLAPELHICDLSAGGKDYVTVLPAGMPLSVKAGELGVYAVTGAGVYFYSHRGALLSMRPFDSAVFGGGVPRYFSEGASGIAILLDGGVDYKNRLIVFDGSGSVSYTHDFAGESIDLLLIGNTSYILTQGGLLTLKKSAAPVEAVIHDAPLGLFEADGKVMLRYSNRVESIS